MEIWQSVEYWREQYRRLLMDYDSDPNAGAREAYQEREQELFNEAWEMSEVRPSDIVIGLDETDDGFFFANQKK